MGIATGHLCNLAHGPSHHDVFCFRDNCPHRRGVIDNDQDKAETQVLIRPQPPESIGTKLRFYLVPEHFPHNANWDWLVANAKPIAELEVQDVLGELSNLRMHFDVGPVSVLQRGQVITVTHNMPRGYFWTPSGMAFLLPVGGGLNKVLLTTSPIPNRRKADEKSFKIVMLSSVDCSGVIAAWKLMDVGAILCEVKLQTESESR